MAISTTWQTCSCSQQAMVIQKSCPVSTLISMTKGRHSFLCNVAQAGCASTGGQRWQIWLHGGVQRVGASKLFSTRSQVATASHSLEEASHSSLSTEMKTRSGRLY